MERLGHAGEFAARSDGSGSALSIGNFDGLHLGHREVVGRCVARARALGVPAVVLTFEPHPLELLDPGRAPRRLTTPGIRASLLADLGVDILVEHPFTAELAEKDPAEFIDDVVLGLLRARFVAVGSGFRFGKGRAGDGRLIERMASEAGFEASVVGDIAVDGEVVSSTRIRGLIARDGDVGAAARLLGRPHSVTGEVVPGRRMGRTLGFPTANLGCVRELLPSAGVYATTARIAGGGVHPAAVHVGPRLTFDGESTVEAHLVGRDPGQDLYGEILRVDFLERVRETRKFEDKDALVSQIRRDVDIVKRMVSEHMEVRT